MSDTTLRQPSRTRTEIATRLRAILREHSGFATVELPETASLSAGLDIDSIDAVEVALAIEDAFDIEIPEERGEHVWRRGTVGDLIDFIALLTEEPFW